VKLIERELGRPSGVILFGVLYLKWHKFCGSEFFVCFDCCVPLTLKAPIHFFGLFLRFGRWGGNIMIKSNRCLEVR
jgi:hypothetical protein